MSEDKKVTVDFTEKHESCLYMICKSGGYKDGFGLKIDGEVVFEIPPIKIEP